MTRKQKKMLFRILVATAATVLLNLIPISGIIRLALFLAVYVIIGYDILRNAARGLFNGRLLDENFLMAIATVGAFCLAIYDKSGDYNEALAVMIFYQTGELFQSCAVGKSRKSIASLMDIRPDSASLLSENGLIEVDPSEVAIGSIIVVAPGEKVPIDGVITSGSSTLDTAALTGESIPREVTVGDEAISGCINRDGLLQIRTTREFGESTVSKILDLVENAGSRKASSEKFISKFARVYTPAVCGAALVLGVVPPLFSLALGGSADFTVWLYRALTFLVISCPCALVISIPLSFFGGIGGASRRGILIKGSNYIETLAQVDTVVFDKTGTLTEGIFRVRDISHNALPREVILEHAALAESASSHPISRSLREAYGAELDLSRLSDVRELRGLGVTAQVDGKATAVGNRRLMESLGIVCPDVSDALTSVHVAIGGEYAGLITVSDEPKSGSKDAISALRARGIKRTVMLSGDAVSVAERIASELGIDEAHGGLLPEDKVNELENILMAQGKSRNRGRVAYVGDGINDAPVLARADVGIAMGAMGSDAAIEAADVVLMDDDPRKLADALAISRRCLSIVKQNIIFSLAVKFICLGLVAAGFANMWLGIFADVGVMVLAVLNSVRTLGK